MQALHSVTITPAYQNHVEDRIGTLTEGKLADFVILDADPIDVAANTPMQLADVRVATTIVGDKVVHGVLPDSDIMLGQLNAGYGQATDVTVSNLSYSTIDHATADKSYGAIGKDEKRLGTLQFSANVTEGKSGVFHFNFLGNDSPVSSFKLHKLYSANTKAYTYGKPAPADMASTTGHWWIADMKRPTVPLAENTTLAKDKAYIAFFMIRDNDTEGFDTDTTPGVIKDPVTLVTTGQLPTNGNAPAPTPTPTPSKDSGGGGGCTVGSTPAYDLLVLFLGLTAVATIRVLRRRNEQ